MLIDEVCDYLNNYFDRNDDHTPLPSWRGEFSVVDGSIDLTGKVQTNQYFRIQNSIFNNGIYKYPASNLKDETFTGKISALAIPADFEALIAEMNTWMEKYGGPDSDVLSPFDSESMLGVYSYSKSKGASGQNSDGSYSPLWLSAFGGRLARWRRFP